MALPRAIQAQIEQANALLDAANKPPEAPAPAAPAQVADPEPAPDPAPAAPEPQATPEPQAQPQPQPDPWEQRYKTLQGLFNREVPTLQTKVKDLEGQLQEAVARLNKAAEAQAKPAEPDKPVADPRDVENFGSDLVEMVQRTAERMFGRAANELQTKAAAIEQRLVQLEQALQGTTQTVAVTAEQAFFDRLTKLVPDWETINANQSFLAWLAEVDPILGQPRQAALDAAQQTLNAERAAAVFKTFAATLPAAPKPNTLDKQVSPKGSASAAPTPPAQPVIYTQQQVVDFYNAKRRGEFRGRDKEAAAIEAELNLAISEGRVR
jgi:hypothetical protein